MPKSRCFILAAAWLALSPGLAAASICVRVSARFANLVSDPTPISHESAVEVETDMRDEVMAMLTTTDGTVAPLVDPSVQTLPEFIVAKAAAKGLARADAGKLPWDSLSLPEKLKLLQALAQTRGATFFQNRAIRGIRIRPVLRLKFEAATTFLGKAYQPGSYDVDVTSVLSGKVEFAGPQEVNDVSGIEYHFRGAESAGTMSADLRTLQRSLDIPTTPQHVHVVAAMPAAALRASPEAAGAELGDHFRRVNYVAEMISIVDEDGTIDRIGVGTVTYFDSLPEISLRGVVDYLISVGRGAPALIGDRFKIGFVGFRGSDKYDQPGLFGYEYRAISADGDGGLISEALDATQNYMNKFPAVTSSSSFRAWLGEQTGKISATDAVVAQWYNRSWSEIFGSLHPQIAPLMDDGFRTWLSTSRNQDEGKEVKMLFHNWINDPLLYQRPDLQRAVLARQLAAVEQVKGGADPHDAVKAFLVESGLYALFRASISGN